VTDLCKWRRSSSCVCTLVTCG